MPQFSQLCVPRQLALALSMLLCSGCSIAYVGRAQTAYSDGRYLEVAEDLAAHEQEVGQLSRPNKVRYGMYRGLSLMRLGDNDSARHWLRFAYDFENAGPVPTLRPRQRMVLDAGWARLKELGVVKAPPPK